MPTPTLWIVNDYAHTPDVPGGTRHYDFGRILGQRGWRVVVWTSSFHRWLGRHVRVGHGEHYATDDVSGVRFIWIRTRPVYQGNDWRRALNMIDFARRVWWLGCFRLEKRFDVPRPDVVVGSSPHLLGALSAWAIARRYRAAFVLEIRDLWPQVLITMGAIGRRHPVAYALRGLERFLYRRARGIVVVPSRGDEYLRSRGVPPDQVLRLPNGVDLSRFRSGASGKSPDRDLTVLYAGSHRPANRLDILLSAARKLRRDGVEGVRITLVGEGSEKPRLMAMAREWVLTNVEFHPGVPKQDVGSVISSADVCIVDTDADVPPYGTGPNKLPDYLAASKPVIILSDEPQDAVSSGFGARVPALDSDALAEEILRFKHLSSAELARMGENGRRYAEEHYDQENLAAKLAVFLLGTCDG